MCYLNYRLLVSLLICLTSTICAQLITDTYTYTGSLQTFTVPQIGCTPMVTVEVRGAKGAAGATAGGNGGLVRGVITASPGQVWYIQVGSQGSLTVGGYNGGGNGGVGAVANGGGGGGASDIRIGANNLNSRVIVGGGGGGSAPYFTTYLMAGAGGGGSLCTSPFGYGGGNGSGCNAGEAGACTGGTATLYSSGGNGGGLNSGGALAGTQVGGYGQAGSLGQGGAGGGANAIYGGGGGGSNGSGGGGGGYYGGSGAMTGSTSCCSGGGGGSSFANTSLFSNLSFSAGIQNGDGVVTITYSLSGPAVVVAASQTAICGNTQVTLTASQVNTYTWSTGAFSNSIAVSPTNTAVYSVAGTNALGCSSSASITIYGALAAPQLSIGFSSTSICLGGTVALIASGAITHTWSGVVSDGVPFSPTITGSYSVVGVNACGSATASQLIVVTPLSGTISTSPASPCVGQASYLSVLASANNYTWLPQNTVTTNSFIAITASANTIYTVLMQNGVCRGEAVFTLSALPLPTVSITATSSVICQGASISLFVSAAATYTWSNSSNTQSISISPGVTSLHECTVTGINGCTNSAFYIVIVKPSPLVSATKSDAIICKGGSTVLQAVGAATYSWSSGASGNTIVVSPNQTTTYSVIGTHTNGCMRTSSVTVNVFEPSLVVSPSATSICEGTNLTISASGALTYSWNGVGGLSIFNFSPLQSTVVVLSASSSSAGISCVATRSAFITVNPTPSVSIVSTKTVVCINDAPLNLSAIGASTYSWSYNNITSSSISFTPTQNTFLSVVGTDSNGCFASAGILLSVDLCTAIRSGKQGLNSNYGSDLQLVVFPNPTQSSCTIICDKLENGFEHFEVTAVDALGQLFLLSAMRSSANELTINLSTLPSNLYIFELTIRNKQYRSQKVVVE